MITLRVKKYISMIPSSGITITPFGQRIGIDVTFPSDTFKKDNQRVNFKVRSWVFRHCSCGSFPLCSFVEDEIIHFSSSASSSSSSCSLFFWLKGDLKRKFLLMQMHSMFE